MSFVRISTAFVLCALAAAAQSAPATPPATMKLALPEHKGQLQWLAPGFHVVDTTAKPDAAEIGYRAETKDAAVSYLGFLSVESDLAPLTSAKCRDGIMNEVKGDLPNYKVISTADVPRGGGLPVAIITYDASDDDGSTLHVVRGFIASGDLCGDLGFYSKQPIAAGDATLKPILDTYRLLLEYQPRFSDDFAYAQILFNRRDYISAAPYFELSISALDAGDDGEPFPSAKFARRIATDQAGLIYGGLGNTAKVRMIVNAAIAKDPDYPIYYYNLACADAQEKQLADAETHLKEAFARRANVNSGETMPDPSTDSSFTPYKDNQEFWSFILSLSKGN